MRIISALVFFLVIFLIFASSAFFVGREVLLMLGASQIKNSVNTLRRASVSSGSYLQECRTKGIADSSSLIESFQLRFDTPTSYVLEVVCRQFSLDPIIIERKDLPPFVKKTPGSSGLIWGQGLTGIGIEIWDRHRGMYLEENQFWYHTIDKETILPGPKTSCEGHGFTCCQEQLSVGEGDLLTEVTDCPRSCYLNCQSRPLVLSLNTQPFFDQRTRVLTIKSGEQLEIGYVVDPQNSKETIIKIDYGDGSSDEFPEVEGRASHVYSCQVGVCRYSLVLTAFNEFGIESAPTPISNLEVQVTP